MADDLSLICLRGIHRGVSCFEAHEMYDSAKLSYVLTNFRVYGIPVGEAGYAHDYQGDSGECVV